MKFEESDVIAGIWRERRFCLFLFCLVNFCTGALYVWSVFAGPLAAQLSAVSGEVVKTSELAPVFGLATGVTPFLMLAGGFVNDRFGPKLTIAFGGAAIAAGYALTAFAESVGMLYVGYGLCVGVGTGLVNGCTINSSVKWFPDRRGFAGGLVTACLGVGAAVLPFAARWMIDVCGIVETLLAFGACSGVVIVLSAFGTRKCPDELQAAFRPAGRAAQAVEAPSMNWLEMVRTPLFYPLFILFTSSAMMGLMLLSNISAIVQEQVGAGAGLAALGVSVISIANTSGRFLSGTLSDRIGRIPTLVLVLVVALAGLGMLVSAGHGDTGHFFAGIVGIGTCFGAFIGTYPSLVADEYGPKHNSVNFSLMMFGYSVGGLTGPLLIRWANAGGDFSRAYMVCVAAAVVGIVCALIAIRLKHCALPVADKASA